MSIRKAHKAKKPHHKAVKHAVHHKAVHHRKKA